MRRDCELRLERLERQLVDGARTADDFIDLMAAEPAGDGPRGPDFVTLVFELFTLSRRNADIAAEYAALDAPHARAGRRACSRLAQRRDVLRLHAEPEAVAEVLFSLGDGLALRMLSEPERDFTPTRIRARRHRLPRAAALLLTD